MEGTIIQQGRFTSDGTIRRLDIRSDVDWMRVYNYNNFDGTGNDSVEFYWQRGMAAATGLRYYKAGGGHVISAQDIVSPNGFTLLDTSASPLGTLRTINSSTDATRPVFTLPASAASYGLVAGDIVRYYDVTGQENLSGYDATIDDLDNGGNNMRWAATLATTPGAAGSGGSFRRIEFDPLYYPRHRFIANITQAASAVITLTVPSGYTVGQEVRIIVPADRVAGTNVYGMVEMDNLTGTITALNDAVGTQTITVDIDSTAFTAFTFPDAVQGAGPLSKAMVVPVGMDTAQALTSSVDILADATDNQSIIGMQLAAGSDSPGGASTDVMYWVAGKSFSVTNL